MELRQTEHFDKNAGFPFLTHVHLMSEQLAHSEVVFFQKRISMVSKGELAEASK